MILNDLLNVGAYSFGAGNPDFTLTGFTPGVAPAKDFALAEWDSNPSPRAWPYVDMHDLNTHTFSGFFSCATEALTRAEMSAATSELTPGAQVVWQPSGQATPVSCAVKYADIRIDTLAPSTRYDGSSGYIPVTVTLRTTPYWLGPEVEQTVTLTAGTPFTGTVGGVMGDVPALTRIRYTHAQATSFLALALRSNPGVGFLPWQDYSGVDDSNSFGGSHTAPVHGTTTPTTLGTPDVIDVADNLGDKLVLVRVGQELVPGAVYRAVSSVQGAVGPAYPIYGPSVAGVTSNLSGWDVIDLGVVSFPAGRVQAGTSGMVYGPAAEVVQAATTSWTPMSAGHNQTFTVPATGRIIQVAGYFKSSPSDGGIEAWLSRAGTALAVVIGANGAVGTPTGDYVQLPLSTPCDVIAGETLTLTFYAYGEATDVSIGYSTANPYAGGQMEGNAANDLTFAVYYQPLVTLGATIGVQESCATASKDTVLDTVVLLPTDEACMKVLGTFAAGEGVCIDNLSENEADHDVYFANTTATGISVVSGCEPYGRFLLRPGDNVLVGMAATPGAAQPGDATVFVTYRPRFTLMYTGE